MDVSTTAKRSRAEQCALNSQTRSQQKRQAAFAALAALRAEGRSITKAAVARRAKVSLPFIRAHVDLVQAIEAVEQAAEPALAAQDDAKDQIIAALRRRLDEVKKELSAKDVLLREKQREIDQLYGKLASRGG